VAKAKSKDAKMVKVDGDRELLLSPKALAVLIKQDLASAEAAAERAGLPYYRAAGEKLLDAKKQLKHGEFTSWVKKNFALSQYTANRYMRLAQVQIGHASPISSGREAERVRKALKSSARPIEPLAFEQVNVEQAGARQEAEREAERVLGLEVISIGYRALAAKFHPDKAGGANVDMTRLNNVRDRLRRAV
jgi:hypothetical protein